MTLLLLVRVAVGLLGKVRAVVVVGRTRTENVACGMLHAFAVFDYEGD